MRRRSSSCNSIRRPDNACSCVDCARLSALRSSSSAVRVENRAKNIFVVAFDAGGTGVGSFVDQSLLGIDDLLNLFLQAGGQLFGIFQFMKVFAQGVFQLQAPQIEQGLIDEAEAALAVESVGEIGNRGERGIENARLAFEPEAQFRGAERAGAGALFRGGFGRPSGGGRLAGFLGWCGLFTHEPQMRGRDSIAVSRRCVTAAWSRFAGRSRRTSVVIEESLPQLASG